MHPIYHEKESLDQRCYDSFKLSPDILMEHASIALSNAVAKKLTRKTKALFVCGPGNNGADGIAAARLLHPKYDVALYLPFKPHSTLAKLQWDRAQAIGVPILKELENAHVFIDALFGSGLNRPLDMQSQNLIETLNARKGYKIACDIPSGVYNTDEPLKVCFHAHETITMGALSFALLGDEAKDAVGKIRVASLGITRKLYETSSTAFLLQKKDMILPIRKQKNTHKGTFGHVAILQGSKEGAAILAGMGAFHFGAGLVSIVGEKSKKTPPYLMLTSSLPANSSVIVAGMGLIEPFDEQQIQSLLVENELPLVIDASLCHHPLIHTVLASGKPLVLTPHPKEFCSLLKLTCNEDVNIETLQANRFTYAKAWTLRFPHSVLVLKGANTIIAHEENLYVNAFGTQALAKGGSGDVLSGMIGALVAQGYSLKDAAISASLAHALVSQKLTCNNFSLTPIDICKGLKWL